MEIPKLLDPMICHGVEFLSQSGTQLVADCVFCGKERHMYVDSATGMWKCHLCGEQGNVISFLTKYAEIIFKHTSLAEYNKLTKLRGLPVRAFKRRRLGFDGTHWLLPCYSDSGQVHDIRRHKPGTKSTMSTKGCYTQLYGVQRLRDVGPKASVLLCEGEWDALAMDEALVNAGVKGQIVMAVPGADMFKKDWVKYLTDRHVSLLYDHDDAGYRGMAKVVRMIVGVAASIQFIHWPKTLPEGYDLRDCYAYHKLNQKRKSMYGWVMDLCKPEHPRPEMAQALPGPTSKATEVKELEVIPANQRPSYKTIVATCEANGLEMDQSMLDGLLYVLSICLSTHSRTNDPVWGWLVSAPGGGKSAIINLFGESDRCTFRSTLHPKTIVSGYEDRENREYDPSLLAVLKDQCLTVQDGTELITQNQTIVSETMGLLRQAFDGSYDKGYGHGVERHYKGMNFTMVIGITPIIYTYDQAALGERFLKLYMKPKNRDELELRRIMKAIEADELGITNKPIQAVVRKFLAREPITTWPTVSTEYKDKLARLCMVVGRLRTQLAKQLIPGGGGDEELLVRPDPEWATRLTRQLIKLGRAACVVLEKTEMDDEVFIFLQKVLKDTCRAFNSEIVEQLIEEDKSLQELVLALDIPRTTLRRRLADLELLGTVELYKKKKDSEDDARKPAEMFVRVTGPTKRLWLKAEAAFTTATPHARRGKSGKKKKKTTTKKKTSKKVTKKKTHSKKRSKKR